MTEYAKLTDRELWEHIARLLGWEDVRPSHFREGDMRGYAPGSDRKDGRDLLPKWVTDLNATRELEGEIERSDRCDAWYQYVAALMRVCRPDGDWRLLSQERIGWICATASPRDRAIAFCVVMAAQTKSGPEIVLEGIQPK